MSTQKTKQVSAVVNAVTEVLGDSFVVGTTVVSEVITSEQKQQVRDLVKTGIVNGEVEYGKDTSNEKELDRYVNGMINNHLKRSKKLNGGSPYQPKKKGLPRDETLRELTKFQATLQPGTEKYNEAAEAISQRRAELEQVRSGIDTTVVTPEISEMVNSEV